MWGVGPDVSPHCGPAPHPVVLTTPCSAPQMWKAVVGHDVSVKVEAQSDDWDTDPDFVVSACRGVSVEGWHLLLGTDVFLVLH